MRVLVIDGARNGLGVIRALAEGYPDLEIHLAAPAWLPAARASRHVRRYWRVPAPADAQAWVAAMVAIGRELADRDGPAILFPVNDIYVLLAARHWEELQPWFRPAFETRADALDRLLSKDRCYDLAERVGVTVPTRAATAAEYVARGGAWPAIVKPALRNAPEFAGDPPFRTRVCATSGELEAACAELHRVGARPVVQEFIAGGDDTLVTAGVAAVEGRILGVFTGRKLRQFPPLVGEASYAESMPAPGAAEGAARMLAEAGFTGVAQVEFKRRDGVDHLLEINPRSWSWIALPTASGVNLPAALIAGIRGRPVPSLQERYGLTWIFAAQDFRYHGRRGGPVGWWRWVRQLVTADVHAHWRWNDPWPVFGFLWTLLAPPPRR